jgi:hypothetical protein
MSKDTLTDYWICPYKSKDCEITGSGCLHDIPHKEDGSCLTTKCSRGVFGQWPIPTECKRMRVSEVAAYRCTK